MIDKKSKEFLIWKEFYGISYFEESYGTEFLYYDNSYGVKLNVDNIALKDFGKVNYLSWTEENSGIIKLIILELEPHRNRQLEWVMAPAKDTCIFWANKWTEKGLSIVYNDGMTNYALSISISKSPNGSSINTTELGEMLCIKKNWIIGYKSHSDKHTSIFDLKNFKYLGVISVSDASQKNIIPSEQGENDEELE